MNKIRFFGLAAVLLLASSLGKAQSVPPPPTGAGPTPTVQNLPFENQQLGLINNPWNRPGLKGPQALSGEIVMSCGPFVVHFDNVKPVGFNHPTAGTAMRQQFCDILTYINSVIVIPSGAQIDIDVESDSTTSPKYIAYAGAYSSASYKAGVPGFYGGLMYDHITGSGADPDTSQHDCYVKVDFNSLHQPGTGCLADLKIVILHELTHALGVASFMSVDTLQHTVVSGANKAATGPFSLWDKNFLYVKKGGSFVKIISATTPTVTPGIVSADLSSANVWLTNAADKSNLPIYSEAPYLPGTSISHFDDTYDINRCHDSPGFVPHYVMPGFYWVGTGRTGWVDQEVRVLSTIGYTIKTSSSFFPHLNNHSPSVDGPVITSINNYDETGVGLNPALTVQITSCQQAQFDLSSRPELHDADGDPIRVFPNSIFNIRGCGSGGNSHSQITVTSSAAGDIITFTPRNNFVGRAQFGFHLYDGKERGALVVYTINVTRDNNCFQATPNIVINGDHEEGQEFYSDTHTSTEFNHLWAEAYIRPYHALYAIVGNWAAPHSDGRFLNQSSVDCKIKDYFKPCEYGIDYYHIYPSPGIPASLGNRLLQFVFAEAFYIQLSEPMVPGCGRYTLSYDFQIPGAGTTDTLATFIGFTNRFGDNYPPNKKSFTMKGNNGAWQHLSYTFMYSDTAHFNNIMSFVPFNQTGNVVYLIDNISLVRDTSYHDDLVVTSKVVNPSCLGAKDGYATALVTGGVAPLKYEWTSNPHQFTQSANSLGAGTYFVSVTDANNCLKSIPVVLTNPGNICGPCYKPYIAAYGSTTGQDSLDAAGGTFTFPAGNVHIISSLKLKNGTFVINSGTTLFIDGHTKMLNGRVVTGSYIDVQNATLNINGATLQAACDTMWGGIRTVYPNSYAPTNNVVNMSNSGNLRATIKDAVIGFQFSEANNINQTNPPVHTGSFNINGASFFNNRTGAYVIKAFYLNNTNTITRTIFDSDGQLKAPYNNQYAKGGLLLYGNCKHDVYSDNSFKRGLFGVYSEGEVYTSKMERDTFVNNYMVGYYNPVSWVDTSVVNNCVFQFATSIPAGVNNTGTITGMYIGNLGFKANKNKFTGPNLPGYTTVGIANSLLIDNGPVQYGYQINNNTFTTNNFAVNNLNMKTRLAQLVGNTFTSSSNAAIFTNASPSGVSPRSFIHCNDFIRGTSNQPAILVTISGALSDTIGRCNTGETAGNNFMLYTGNPAYAISNQGTPFIYARSTTEGLTANPGILNTSGNVGFASSCGQGSGCLGTGVGLPFPPIREVLQPATALVETAVTTLRQGVVTPLTEQIRLITRIVDSYSGNCSPTYQSVVDQMLPNNLTAYNALAWNLTECYIANRNIPAAISLMQAINYHNPTDVAIQQRTNFYTVMLRLSGLSTSAAYRATVQDADVLVQVAASGTEFSAAACYTLMGIDPARASSCLQYPAPLPGPSLFNLLGGSSSSMALDSAGTDSTALLALRMQPVLFDSKPNPFSVSTTVRYTISDQVKTAVLRVYDVQGSLVRSVQLDKQAAEVSISAEGLKNGVYLYTIEADGLSMVKKRLVVIK